MHPLQNALAAINEQLESKPPEAIISWAAKLARRPVVTTSFGTYSAALLHAVTRINRQVPVIWCDTGYNTSATYRHVETLTALLELNLDIFTPSLTTAYIENMVGKPEPDNPNHDLFARKVKLEPFERAFKKYDPDVWFTNLRKGQTHYRDSIDILSFSKEGILKVSPFYHYSDAQLMDYIKTHDLPLEFDYYDPVKALSHRECGIHFLK